MPSLEDRRRAEGPAGGAAPTSLHLKKELGQLRKAARGALKDPGTSSASARPFASSDQSNGNDDSLSSQLPLHININGSYSNGAFTSDNESDPDAKQAFLFPFNDREIYVGDDVKDDVSSFDNVNSGNDSRSDGCLSSTYGSTILRCNNANVAPSIRRTIRKKSKRVSYSSTGSRPHKDRMQILLNRYTKSISVIEGSSFGDDTDDYCNSPLLTRLKNYRGGAQSPTKSSSSYKKEADSVSYNNRYSSTRNLSIVESWDADTRPLNDDDVDVLIDLSGQQKGCGIPCCWSRRSTPKSGSWSCHSPSLSETPMMRKGSETGLSSRVPLLRNDVETLGSDDENFENFRELDLEVLSRLDRKMFSSSFKDEVNDEGSPEHMRSLSQKYRPRFFEELIGQNIVVKALTNAVIKARVSPLYLFHGPHGVGKMSAARIFSSALNCLSIEETKPCGVCRECADSMSGKSRHLMEVDGSNKRGIERVKYIFKKLSAVYFEKYKVFVVNECHLLPSRAWLTFLRILENPLPRVVFVLVSSDIDSVPRAVLSRCQKHFFNKISHGDIVTRLRIISGEERLDVEFGALDLVASNADGSMRDAEITLEQLSLLGKRITKSLVNELIGVGSDEKLMELLKLAMSSNATETVIRARELMDSGVDPTVLMSQLVALIVDVIAGTCPTAADETGNDSFVGGRSLTERDLDRLKHALTILSEAENRLRFSCERTTWFTASLLQLGSLPSPDRKTRSLSSQRRSFHSAEESRANIMLPREETKQITDTKFELEKANFDSTSKDSETMNDVWMECIEKCHSQTLRQLLLSYGNLVSLSEAKGGFVAHIEFADGNIKTRAQGFLSSITNSFEMVLRCNVEVKLLDSSKLSRGSFVEPLESMDTNGASTLEDCRLKLPLRRLESIIHEERLESAWLQAMDRNTPVSMSPSKPEMVSRDELEREVNELKLDKIVLSTDRRSISLSNDSSMGQESGSGVGVCGGMLCWNKGRRKAKRSVSRSGRFSWFGECAKARHTDNSLIL